jgi:hypothetical protein
MPVRAILDELLRDGAVEMREDGFVALRQRAFVPATERAAEVRHSSAPTWHN